MKTLKGQLQELLQKPLGMIVALVLLFYVMTFLVYYLYSPGPEERRQSQAEITETTS